MNLTKPTLDVLKNFAQVNPNLHVPTGKKINTKSPANDIYAEYEADEDFPVDVSVYNLPEFLGVVSLFGNPDFTFDKKEMTIKEGRTQVKYVYSDPSVLSYPTKTFNKPTMDIELVLTGDTLLKVQKAAGILGVGDLAVIGDGKNTSIRVYDSANPSSNDYVIDLDRKTTANFNIHFKVEKFGKLYGGDYDVGISSKKVASFEHKSIALKYFMSVESDSTF